LERIRKIGDIELLKTFNFGKTIKETFTIIKNKIKIEQK